MGTARSQSENDVARFDVAAVNNLALFDNTDGKAGKVVFTGRIHARHFGRFAADQCAAGQFAAVCDAFDNAFGNVDIKMTAGEVVKEE